jgi:hypothetical protein
MLARPDPLLLGYALKSFELPAGWRDYGSSAVTSICSVSECIAKRPAGWVDRWDFNDAGYYATPAEAAAAPHESETPFALFGYEFFPLCFGANGATTAVTPESIFDMKLRPLTPGSIAPGFEFLGYDAVERWASLTNTPNASFGGFGCSPLSCNGLAAVHPVNSFCLAETWEAAVALAEQCAREQPEPGDYFIFGVWRRP